MDDLRSFFLHRPETPTLIDFATAEERRAYSYRILQRLDIDPEVYSVLNVHRIGIDVPVSHVFDELLSWSGESSCWPNHIATVDSLDGAMRHVLIRPFGIGAGRRRRRWDVPPLFALDAIRVQGLPEEGDTDNARYLLYSCSGGYPIGFFCMFVRSPVAERGETEAAQFFMAVAFDFYGKKRGFLFRPIDRLWEAVHNRVTGNVLHRFKRLCEWRFAHGGRSH